MDSTTILPTARNSDCQFWSDWNQNSDETRNSVSVSVGSPWWRLTDESQLELEGEVTRTAVGLAHRRAELMAEASGFSTVVPLQLADTGLLGEAGAMTQAAAMAPKMMARSAYDSGAADEGFDLTPRDVEVSVTLEARFRAQ